MQRAVITIVFLTLGSAGHIGCVWGRKSINNGMITGGYFRPRASRARSCITLVPLIRLFCRLSFEWLCKHNSLRPQPIRFVRLDSEHAQSDGKSVNRGLPELDLARGPEVAIPVANQKDRGLWERDWSISYLESSFLTVHTPYSQMAASLGRARGQT